MQINKNWLILGLLTALIVVLFFFTCNKSSAPKAKYIPVVSIVEKKLKTDSVQYFKSIDSIKKIELKWKNKYIQADGDLSLAEQQMNDMLNSAEVIIDSSDNEELKAQLEELKALNEGKDILVHIAISSRDSLIQEKENKYLASLEFQSKQRQSINELINSNKASDSEIKHLNKQVRKQKANKVLYKVIAGAAIILAAKQSL